MVGQDEYRSGIQMVTRIKDLMMSCYWPLEYWTNLLFRSLLYSTFGKGSRMSFTDFLNYGNPSEYQIHLNTWQYGCLVFKWLSNDLADHKQGFSVWFSYHHSNTGPFDNRTQIYHSGIQTVTLLTILTIS